MQGSVHHKFLFVSRKSPNKPTFPKYILTKIPSVMSERECMNIIQKISYEFNFLNFWQTKRPKTKPSDIFKRPFILTVRNIYSTVQNV